MMMRHPHVFVAIYAFLFVALLPAVASAGKSEPLVISLNVDQFDIPNLVCLITEHDPSMRHAASSSVWYAVPHPIGKPPSVDSFQGPDGKPPKINDPIRKIFNAFSAPDPKKEMCGPACRPNLRVASDVVWPKDAGPMVAAPVDAGPMDAATKAPSYYLSCRQNELLPPRNRDDHDELFLILSVAFEENHQEQAVSEFRVQGATITVSLLRQSKPGEVATVSVSGGHYVDPGQAVPVFDNRVVIPIARHCRRHFVTLPPFVPPKSSVRYLGRVKNAETGKSSLQSAVDVCPQQEINPDPTGRASILLPYNGKQEALELSVEANEANDARRTWRFSAWWTDPVASPTVDLQVVSASFSWEPVCIAPHTECPDAILADAGVDCSKSPVLRTEGGNTRCEYACEGPNHNAIKLPTKVRFSDNRGSAWTSTLGQVNQTLTEYLPPEEHSITIDFGKWMSPGEKKLAQSLDQVGEPVALSRRPWETIEFVEVRSLRGIVARVTPEKLPQRVHLPGVACSDYVSYQIVGERSYRERPVQLGGDPQSSNDGASAKGADVLAVDPPAELVSDIFTLGFTLGAGMYLPLAAPIDIFRPYAVVEGIITLRPLPTGRVDWPTLFLARPWVELRVGYIFTSQWYVGVAVPGGDANNQVPYSRVPISGIFQFPLSGHFYLGVGAGGVYGGAFLHQDFAKVGNPQVSFMPVFDLGYRPGGGMVAVEGTLRMFANETQQEFDTDFHGTPVMSSHSTVPLFGEIKLRVGR